jgi:transketolase
MMNGGLGDAVAQVLVKNSPAPQEFVAVNDTFGESGTPNELLKKYHLETVDIVLAAERALARKNA